VTLKSLLLDADIIIFACELDLLKSLQNRCSILVPSIVAYGEAKYFKSSSGRRRICLSQDIAEGRASCVEADASEVLAVTSSFVDAFSIGLDPGEKEALGLLLAGKCPEAFFCTGDVNAMQAAGMLDLESRLISFESVLGQFGLAARGRNAVFQAALRD
jgi:hypothetical protein